MESNFKHTAEDLRREIETILQRVGILCRVFGRGKEPRSLEHKQNKIPGKYEIGGKLIQDAIGIRVALYFLEDVEIVAALLSSNFVIDSNSSTIDLPKNDQFTVMRHNLIFKVPEMFESTMSRNIGTLPIANTFEVQLRSVLSEGWHEVDHDLRYKCKEDWAGQDDLSRALNGIMGTLETAEWGMKMIFDDLAYRHYKQKNWIAMLRSTLRMRADPTLSPALIELLNNDEIFAKEVLQISRKKIIKKFHELKPRLPVTFDNIIYIWNHIGPKNSSVLASTPALIRTALDQENTLR